MKKNNKFRNNSGNSNAYSLNYKFDSISPAGKINGTALDLIKRYNELAKEAHGSGDYIEMEVYRQYAEHYRKIVTEINERRAVRAENTAPQADENSAEATSESAAPQTDEAPAEAVAEPSAPNAPAPRKSFKVIEIQPQNNNETAETEATAPVAKPRRIIRRIKKPTEEAAAAAAF